MVKNKKPNQCQVTALVVCFGTWLLGKIDLDCLVTPGTFSLSSLTFPSVFSFPLSFVFILWAFNESLLALTEGIATNP